MLKVEKIDVETKDSKGRPILVADVPVFDNRRDNPSININDVISLGQQQGHDMG